MSKSGYQRLDRETMTTVTLAPEVAATVRSYMLRNRLNSMSHAIEVKFADEKLNEKSFGLWGRNKKESWNNERKQEKQ